MQTSKNMGLEQQRDWSEMLDLLQSAQSLIFSTHLEPDADGAGSQLALARYLKRQGKEVHILNPTALRTNLQFLTEGDEIEIYSEADHLDTVNAADLFIAFDIGSFERLGDLTRAITENGIIKVSIDHHPGDKSQFDVCLDDPTASSTGVLIYDLLCALDKDFVPDMELAHPLYAAIMSDTGNFRFNNTDFETLSVAAVLIAAGVKPYEMYVEIYENLNTPGRIIVLKHVLDTMHFAEQGRLAWASLDYDHLQALGAMEDDLHGLSDFIRSIKGVEIAFVLIKSGHAPIDVSMRSKGKYSINGVAGQFGGGGHAFAAGCRIDSTLESAVQSLTKAFTEVLANG